jgi:hypothetical protein
MEILLAGKVDVPSITCPKELFDADMKERLIPVVIKKPVGSAALTSAANAGSKFRLPFKNNGTQEIEVEFTFSKQSSTICGPMTSTPADKAKSSLVTSSPIEFTIGPGGQTLKLPPNGGLNNLNLTAKFKNAYQLLSLKAERQNAQNGATPKQKQAEKYTHLLIGKVKDTQIMFSYIIEVCVVE